MISEELKIYLKRAFPFLAFFIFVPVISYSVWYFYPKKNLEILVIDKTVPETDLVEHSSLYWVLEYEKYTKKNSKFYDKKTDYLGYFPGDQQSKPKIKDLASLTSQMIKDKAANLDVLYITDTYGVYSEPEVTSSGNQLPPRKIYGGMDQKDLEMIREVKSQEKTLIAEFNSMASPTTKEVRTKFENLMGIQWTGWIGRYFEELDTLVNPELPGWITYQYKLQHDGKWMEPGPGLIFIHEDGKIEGLTFEEDYQNKIPLIRTQRINQLGQTLPDVVPYPDWFDVVLIERAYNVISYYDINPTTDGLEKLRTMGLPRYFPAAVVKNNGKGKLYYFSGDFSDMRNHLGSARFKGLPFLWRGMHFVSDYTDRESFFWNYYFPLTSKILEVAYDSKD